MLRLLLIAILATALASCNTSGCTDGRSAVPRAAFYDSATGKAIAVDSVAILGVGQPGDSLIVEPTNGTATFNMPLRSDTTAVRWCIRYDKFFTDTITLQYTPQIWFASEACGVMYRYHIDTVGYTGTAIDSVTVPQPDVTNVTTTNVAIYLRTGL